MSPPDAEPPEEPTPGPLLAGPAPLPPASQRRRSWLRRTSYALAAPLVFVLVRLLWATCRVRVEGGAELDAELAAGRPVVLAFWHDQLFGCAFELRRRFRPHELRMAFLISPSVDGDVPARVAELGGHQVVRGSATRSGVKSLRDLYRRMRADHASPVLVIDGPQGPRHECKPGALLLAQLAGAQLVPLACAGRGVRHLRTWDRMMVPLPFARLRIVIGEPFPVGARAAGEELERLRRALGERMEDLMRRAAEESGARA